MSLTNMLLVDVSGEPSARSGARFAPQFSQALEKLGFQPVGVLIARTRSQEQYENSIRRMMSPQDADTMVKIVAAGEAVEIMASPDCSVFGVVERSVSGPVIALETVFTNGVVVDTTMRPTRAPHPVSRKPGNTVVRLLGMLLMGRPPIWPRLNSPVCRFFVELVDTRDTQILYMRHQARVREVQHRFPSPLALHSHLDIYRAIRIRQSQIAIHRKIWMDRVGKLSILLLIPLIFAWVFATHPATPLENILNILLILVIAFLALLALSLFGRVAVSRIPLRLSPLAELIKLQNLEWGERSG